MSEITISESIDYYLKQIKNVRGFSQKSVDAYAKELRRFVKWIVDRDVTRSRAAQLSDNDIVAYFEQRFEQDSLSTIHKRASIVRGYLKYLEDRDVIPEGMYRLVQVQSMRSTRRKVVSQEQRKLIDVSLGATQNTDEIRKQAIIALALSGLTTSEICGLEKQEIDYKKKMVRPLRKMGNCRIYPVSQEVLGLVKRQIDERPEFIRRGAKIEQNAVFTNRYGGKLSVRSIQRLSKKWLQEVGLENVTLKDLRNTTLKAVEDKGYSGFYIMKALATGEIGRLRGVIPKRETSRSRKRGRREIKKTESVSLTRREVEEIAGEYLREARGNVNAGTYQHYKREIEQFEQYLNEHEIGFVNNKRVLEYIEWQKQKGKSVGTRRYSIINLKMMFNYAEKQGLIVRSPTRGMVLEIEERDLPGTLSIDKVVMLLTRVDFNDPKDVRDVTMLHMIYSTGMAVSEITGLKEKELDTENKEVRLLRYGKKVELGYGTVTERLLREYFSIRPDGLDDSVFLSNRRRGMTRQAFWGAVKKRAKRIGVKGRVTPRELKNAFLVHMLEYGEDVRSLPLGSKDEYAAMERFVKRLGLQREWLEMQTTRRTLRRESYY